MAVGQRPSQPHKASAPGWSARRWIILTVQVVFVGWLVYEVAGGLWQANAKVEFSVPHSLGDLALVSSEQGERAIHQFRQLHGKDVEMRDGYVANYSSARGEATLYVGQAENPAAAEELNERMRALIAQGNSPFKNLARREAQGRGLYQLDGLGADHFFYAVDDKVVWLSVTGGKAEEALISVLSAVK